MPVMLYYILQTFQRVFFRDRFEIMINMWKEGEE